MYYTFKQFHNKKEHANADSPSATFRRHKSGAGFVALMSSIIISVMLMMMVFSVSTSSFYARLDAMGKEHKRESLELAESCMNIAFLRLGEDDSWKPAVTGDSVTLGNNTCVIDSVEAFSSGYPKILNIKTRAGRLGAWSNVKAGITIEDPNTPPRTLPAPPRIALNFWEEVAAP